MDITAQLNYCAVLRQLFHAFTLRLAASKSFRRRLAPFHMRPFMAIGRRRWLISGMMPFLPKFPSWQSGKSLEFAVKSLPCHVDRSQFRELAEQGCRIGQSLVAR